MAIQASTSGGSYAGRSGTKEASLRQRLAAHQELAERLDAMGEEGMPLEGALISIFNDLEDRGIIERVL
jgi:hypothetical protein